MNLLKNFRIYDLVVISLMAALGLAVKIVVTPLTHMISGPLNMPGGALAGGFYMFWIVLAGALVGKRGAATLTALVQALMVIVVGSVGSHGIMSVITYTMPGLMVDLVFLVFRREIKTNIDFFAGGMIANMTGTFLTGMVFFRLPAITMVMIVTSGMLSGGLGGLIAYATYRGVRQIENMGVEEDEDRDVGTKRSFKGVIVLVAILGIMGFIYLLGGFGDSEALDSGVSELDGYTDGTNGGEATDDGALNNGETNNELINNGDIDNEGTENGENTLNLGVDFDSTINNGSVLEIAQPLLVTGDVVNGGYIEEYANLLSFQLYMDNGFEEIRIETTALLEGLELRSDRNKIYLIGSDGFMVGLEGDTLTGTYVAYNQGNGWMFVSDQHPVNSGIKQMSEIVVVSEYSLEDFNMISDEANHFYSYGTMRLMMSDLIQVLDGVSTLDGVEIDVMKIKEVLPVSDLVDTDEALMIATADGDLIYEYSEPGYLEFSQGNIRYHSKDLTKTYQNVLGIMVNPPSASIKDHYYDVQHYLDKGIKVLSIFVDGTSYRQYEALVADDEVDFMDSLSGVQPATVGFKPVTNVGFTTMITGVDPSLHGVHDRSYREPAVPTIFDYCNEAGISNGLIEGNVQILMLNTETILNIDENGNGITDDEIHETAMETINQYEYVMVHYHSVDEFGHDYGEFAKETMSELKLIDSYVEELVSGWDGKVILLADHGMHTTAEGGDHGAFRIEDFVVPYVIFDGGQYEKE